MPKPVSTTDIRNQFILLGTGTSVGVPCIGCGCDVCQSSDSRDKRTRCGALLGTKGGLHDGVGEPRFSFCRSHSWRNAASFLPT